MIRTAPLPVVQLAGSAEWAGGERSLELLATHLDRRRFRLEVILPGVPVHRVDLGRLVRPGAIGEVRELVRDGPKDPNCLRDLGRHGRASVEARFSQPPLVSTMAEMFRRLIGRDAG